MPQAFFRFGSTRLACCVVRLEMRLTLVKTFGAWAAEASAGTAATSPAVAANAAAAGCHLLPRASPWPPVPGAARGHGTHRYTDARGAGFSGHATGLPPAQPPAADPVAEQGAPGLARVTIWRFR